MNDSLIQMIKTIQGNRSVRAFAADCDISPASLTRIYKGEYTPSAKTLEKMSDSKSHPQGNIEYEDLMVAAGYQKDYAKEAISDIADNILSKPTNDKNAHGPESEEAQKARLDEYYRTIQRMRVQAQNICRGNILINLSHSNIIWRPVNDVSHSMSRRGFDWGLENSEKHGISEWYFRVVRPKDDEHARMTIVHSIQMTVGKLAMMRPAPKRKYTLVFDQKYEADVRRLFEPSLLDDEPVTGTGISYRGNLSIMFMDYSGNSTEISEMLLSSYNGDPNDCRTM